MALGGDLKDKKDVIGDIGKDAKLNPHFFRDHATGEEALRNYGDAISYNNQIFNKIFANEQQAKVTPASYTKNADTTGKPFTSMTAFQEAAAHLVSDDRSPALAGIKEAKIELVRWAKPQQPVFSLQPNLTM